MGSAEKIYDLEAGVNFRARLARIERREKREREKKKLSKSKNKIWRSPNSIASKRQSSINKQMVETSIARLPDEPRARSLARRELEYSMNTCELNLFK